MSSNIGYTYNYDPYYFTPSAFEPTARQRATLILVLVTSVIIIIISFEMIKDFSISSANIYTKPIIETVFAEMTVLGFISVVGYTLKYGGALDDVSVYWFGEVGKDYVEEVLEDAHYFLFLVMVLTVFQIYLMITITHYYMDKFDMYNDWCQNKSDMLNYLAEIDDVPPQTVFEWLYDYVSDPLGAWGKHARRQEVEELVVFFILREEHILKRSSLPPYSPAPKNNRLPVNFDYADYVSINLARLLQEVVRFTPLMWLGVWGFAVVAFLLMLMFDGVYLAMGFMLVAFIYADAAAMFALRKNCAKIFNHFVNAEQVRAMEDELAQTLADPWSEEVSVDLAEKPSTILSEQSYLSSPQKAKPSPPKPLKQYSPMFIRTKFLLSKGSVPKQPVPVQTSKKTVQQSLLSKIAGGNVPNAQQQLFFGDSIGKTLNIYVFRLHLVLQSFYYSVMACFFIPYAYAHYNVYISSALCVAALVPLPLLYVSLYGRLLVSLTHLASAGCYINVNVEKQVLLKQKTKKIVKLLLMLTKIHAAKTNLSNRGHLDEKMSREVDHVATVFDKYDKDGDGQIDIAQLRPLLQSLGMAIDEMRLHHMFELMDEEDNGLVSKDEFLAWFTAQRIDTRANIEELAHELFHSMEESSTAVDRRVLSNSSTSAKGGEMTKREFIVAFKKFNDAPYNAGLSDDEIEDMADEFDETGDGMITWKEFFHVVKTGLEKRK